MRFIAGDDRDPWGDGRRYQRGRRSSYFTVLGSGHNGMLQAMMKSCKPGQAFKIRHYAKYMRRISDPTADMFFRMASAISRNPDKEFEMKPPPLVVSYEE